MLEVDRGIDFSKEDCTPERPECEDPACGGRQPDVFGANTSIPLSPGDKNECFNLYLSHSLGRHD